MLALAQCEDEMGTKPVKAAHLYLENHGGVSLPMCSVRLQTEVPSTISFACERLSSF
jgi:hypothetical protein